MSRTSVFAALIVLAAALLPAPAVAERARVVTRASVRSDVTRSGARVPGEVVVHYRSSADREDRSRLRDAVDARLLDRLPSRTEVVEVPTGEVRETIAALESLPEVSFAEPNFIYRASALPNDPRFGQAWGLNNTGQAVNGAIGTPDSDIDAPEAWDSATGSRDVVVAVVDSGIAYNHPDLVANIWRNAGESGDGKETNGIDDDDNGFVDDWRGWDFVGDDNAPRDLLGHGTHVAGTIGAVGNDGSGTAGVNWQVSLMPVRVLNAEGVGTSADVGAAISYAAANGADVINISLGGADFSLAVASAVTGAASSLLAVAAGNEASNNDTTPSYPCNYASTNIVCVAATDQADNLAGYSNYGAASVDIAAPGSRILSTVPSFIQALSEGFEGDISSTWTTGGTGAPWERDLDALGYFVTDSPSGAYLPSSDTWLRTSSPVDLSGLENCQLNYVFSLDTEPDLDFFHVEGSSNAISWSKLGSWSGSTGGDWLSGTHDLSPYDGASVYLRFRVTSNLLINGDGASVDDVEVGCLSSNFSGDEFSYASGTSMAAPHVAGAAALLLSASPAASVATVRNALLAGVDPVNDLLGKVASGGRLNLANALGFALSAGVPLPTASPSASSSVSPSPTTSPSASPGPALPVAYERSLGLQLRGHLRARGRVIEESGLPLCTAGIEVRIKRNGKVIKRVRTGEDGRYSTRLPDRPGRYRARVARNEALGAICDPAASPLRRHRT